MNSAPVRILEVIGNAIVGGMESWVERLIERLPRERFEFTALCPFESPYTDRLRALGVEVQVAPMPDDPPWSTVQMAAAMVVHRRIELLHAHLPKAHLLAALAGGLTRRPVLATVHGQHLTALDLELHHTARSHLSVVCRQSYFHALGAGVDPALLSWEANGVDTDRFRPGMAPVAGSGAGLRATLGLAAGVPLVGFVGRLSGEKGPEVFVRAMMILRSHRPDVQAVLVGEGAMHEELQSLIERFALQQQVHLVGLRHDMPAVYSELDLLVSCSHTEAMPLVLMEAMACGVPAVATRVGGVTDIVAHDHSGWLVAPGDFDGIGNACAALLADAPRRLRMGAVARARAVDRLSLGKSVDRVADLLTRLARPRLAAAAAGLPVVMPAAVPSRSRRGAHAAASNAVSSGASNGAANNALIGGTNGASHAAPAAVAVAGAAAKPAQGD